MDAAMTLRSAAGRWQSVDQFGGGTIIDHTVPGVQSLNLVLLSEPAKRAEVAEGLAALVSPLRIAHDRISAAKRRMKLKLDWPLQDHPWPLIRALDNLQKHQEAPPLYWRVTNATIEVYTNDGTRQVGTIEATPGALPIEDRYVEADHLRLVDDIPKQFRGPDYGYLISELRFELVIGQTDEHPIEYPLRAAIFDLMKVMPMLVAEAEGSELPDVH